ncbi:MAG: ZPR1 zinc finger domain-containing protein [Nanoarchaeota archaeon]|nr:ZPR1 zinc finger domain-containing protein [Nanoarchaeota archaeon]
MRKHHFNSLVFNALCSQCETDSVIIHQRMIDLPEVGKTLRINSYCENCHVNSSEFVPFHDKKNSVFKFLINDKLDLNAKVIKSQDCTFRIPELGVELEPGPESQAEIINVEGVLSNITLALDYEYGSNKLSNDIARIRKGKKKVTLVLDDPMGVSRVIPRKS